MFQLRQVRSDTVLVTGVFKNITDNNQFHLDILGGIAVIEQRKEKGALNATRPIIIVSDLAW